MNETELCHVASHRHLTREDAGSCRAKTEIPDGYAILIDVDAEFNPATSVDWDENETAEYVRRHRAGEFTAYGVSLIREEADGVDTNLGSLWGCDVNTSSADGLYTTLASIEDEYLREVAADLIIEAADEIMEYATKRLAEIVAEDSFTPKPFHGAQVLATIPHFGYRSGKWTMLVLWGSDYVVFDTEDLAAHEWVGGRYFTTIPDNPAHAATVLARAIKRAFESAGRDMDDPFVM